MKKLASIVWKSPSNIAFIKYWGKSGNQYPKNPSLSMTLEKCYTMTEINVFDKTGNARDIDFTFSFKGKNNPQFTSRLHKYFFSISERIPILKQYIFQINSNNSFPHSAGIASSASAMSAMALCLTSLEQKIGNGLQSDFLRNAAVLARLGSGSATRSLFGGFSIWGEVDALPEASNEYGVPIPFLTDKCFSNLRDTILIIDSTEKKVSSSAGHSLMDGHPYAEQRYLNARSNLNLLMDCLKAGDFDEFARILELEALSLHALMLTAYPWYSLLSPNTLIALERIRDFREKTKIRVTFTLDAGPNVHVIFPVEEESRVAPFIEGELSKLCVDQMYIKDNVGRGPELLMEEYY